MARLRLIATMGVVGALAFTASASATPTNIPSPETCDGQSVQIHSKQAAKVVKNAYDHSRWRKKHPFTKSHKIRYKQHYDCIFVQSEQTKLDNYKENKAKSFRKFRKKQLIIHDSQFDKRELMKLWVYANGKLGNPELMAAIGIVEGTCHNDVSTRKACARSHGPPDGRGIWQIEWPLWRGRLSKFGNPYKPLANAKMAGEVLKTQGVRAWVAYQLGRHCRFYSGC